MNGRLSVTVVIPCFNQSRFLPAAVASVRAQSYGTVECVVVNDGSTDDTATVASAMDVRLIEQPNRGVSAARNAGLSATRTDLIVFLDADDELLPDAVARAAEALAVDPDAALVVGRCEVMDADGRALPAFHDAVDTTHLYEAWLSRNFVWTPGAAMFRRSALADLGGFPQDVGPAADYAIYLRFARAGRVRVIPDELVRYRQHDASMSRDPALMLRATLAVLRGELRQARDGMRERINVGWGRWCDWYGEQIVSQLRIDWRARRVGEHQVRALMTLLRYCPRVALRHARRKAERVLRHDRHAENRC
jgi:glycosyltransferase involved in cell wall biosynthesis